MILYPESVIREFSKASKRINIFIGSKNYPCEEHSTMYDEAPYEKSHDIAAVEKSITNIQEQMKRHEERLLQMKRHVL